MSSILDKQTKFRLKLGTILKYVFLLFCLAWPWQTRYFLVVGANEYLTRSIYLSDLLVLALLVFVIMRPKVDFKVGVILKYFFWGLLPVAVLAITQFTLQASFSTKWLGLAKHDPAELGQVVIETANGRYLRAYGSFDHPNILGGVMAAALLLVLINLRKKWGAPEIVYTALFSSALFFSFSRGSWLALLVGLGVYFGVSLYKKQRIRKEFFIILAACSLLLAAVYSPLVFARVAAEGRIEQKSIDERIGYYGEAKELFLAHPYFGVGFRNYVPSLMELHPGRATWSYQPVHNSFILALVELGAIGASLLIVAAALLIRMAKGSRLMDRPEILALCSLVVVLSLFDHWLWSLHAGWLFIGLLAVISVKLIQENN
jgi:hypothetical protein